MDIELEDPSVSLTAAISWALWALAVTLVLVDFFTDIESGEMGVIAAIGAATLVVRGYFVDLERRERVAFELGVEAGRRHR